MKRVLVSFFPFTFLVLLGLTACPPSPVVPNNDADAAIFHYDAGDTPDVQPVDVVLPPDADIADRACATLAGLGCAEAFPKVGTCADKIREVQAKRLTNLRPDCLAAATSKEQARACKSVTCP